MNRTKLLVEDCFPLCLGQCVLEYFGSDDDVVANAAAGRFEACQQWIDEKSCLFSQKKNDALLAAAKNGYLAIVKLFAMQDGVVLFDLAARIAEKAGHDEVTSFLRQEVLTRPWDGNFHLSVACYMHDMPNVLRALKKGANQCYTCSRSCEAHKLNCCPGTSSWDLSNSRAGVVLGVVIGVAAITVLHWSPWTVAAVGVTTACGARLLKYQIG